MSNKTSDKNVANIQDDVKIVKEFIDYAQGIIEDMEYERPVDVTVYQKELTSMTNILAEREQDKKRIQELEEQVKTLDEAYTGVIKESKKWFDIAHNSIPMQVVIDKMEELNKEIKSCDEIDAIFKIKQQQILQELLEGAGK